MRTLKFVNSSETVFLRAGSVKEPNTLLSDYAVSIFLYVILTSVCEVIDLFGVGSNIINIMCFIRQGFKDPINVSLFGLAVADLLSLVTLLWTNICYTPALAAADLAFDPVEFQYLISGIPHVTFTRVTGWITAIITLERCLCITIPLQVSVIVTTRRVTILIIGVFVVLTVSVAPVYAVNKLGWRHFPHRNRTLLGLIFAPDREIVEKVSFAVNNVFVPFTAFALIIICTIILSVKLHRKSKWRKTMTTTTQSNIVSNKNQKVAKMVIMISVLFISCFIPLSVGFIAMTFEPGLSVTGKYRNIMIVIGGFSMVLESVNSSTNIFIYYHMSSKYRLAFCELFLKRRK